MKDLCVVIGGAQCWEQDLDNFLEIVPDHVSFDIAVINDHMGSFDMFPISWIFTLHPEKIDNWLSARIKPTSAKIVTIQKPNVTLSHEVFEYVPHIGLCQSGSSGLYAVCNLLNRYGYRKVVACGIPMTSEKNYFRDEKNWQQSDLYYKGWKNPELRKILQPRFRSMSGWTKGRFLAPDKEWLLK